MTDVQALFRGATPMLDAITPVLLTRNEAPNIARTLAPLSWAKRIVIVDSFSDDETLEIACRNPVVEVFQRAFDDQSGQWTYAISETGIKTPWVLALDADYVLTPEFVAEMAQLRPSEDVSGYRAHFRYCIGGRPLRGALYPPVVALYRLDRACYIQDGHTQRLHVRGGRVLDVRGLVLHDDRKPLARWVRAQARYAEQEAEKLKHCRLGALSWPDRIRRIPLAAPLIVPWYCLLVKGLALDGVPGLSYAVQRTLAELLLSLRLLSTEAASTTSVSE